MLISTWPRVTVMESSCPLGSRSATLAMHVPRGTCLKTASLASTTCERHCQCLRLGLINRCGTGGGSCGAAAGVSASWA